MLRSGPAVCLGGRTARRSRRDALARRCPTCENEPVHRPGNSDGKHLQSTSVACGGAPMTAGAVRVHMHRQRCAAGAAPVKILGLHAGLRAGGDGCSCVGREHYRQRTGQGASAYSYGPCRTSRAISRWTEAGPPPPPSKRSAGVQGTSVVTKVSLYGLTWPRVIGGPCRGSPRDRSSRGPVVPDFLFVRFT